jgi:hypothetical protein
MWPLAALTPATAQQRADQESSTRQERRQQRFRGMDQNDDGVITRAEWRGNARSFDRHDINDDGVLSGNEIWVDEADPASGGGPLEQVFQAGDTDHDGRLSRREWASGDLTFRRVDVNGDGVVSLSEFLGEGWNEAGSNEAVGTSGVSDDISGEQEDDGRVQRNTRAYQSGYDRGVEDGRQAGREDKQYRNQWDLQGQQELEQADAGYHASLGSREEYQAGYRRGFRAGYRQGFGDREPRE